MNTRRSMATYAILIIGLASGRSALAQSVDVGGLFGAILQGAIRAQQERDASSPARRQRYDEKVPTDYSESPAPPPIVENDPLHPTGRQATPSIGTPQPSPRFSFEGMVLGGTVDRSRLTGDFDCQPSDQFPGSTWCRRRSNDPRKPAASLFLSRDGRLLYAGRIVDQATLRPNDVAQEIQRLSLRYGTQAQVITVPARPGSPIAVIATWGSVRLDPLDATSLKSIAEGKHVREGILVDYLGDFPTSARSGLPIFRIAGGPGSIWAASYDQGGQGKLRFGIADASAWGEPIVTASLQPAAVAGQGLTSSPTTMQAVTKTVTVIGVGTDLEAAAKNAAENALTQVVGTFIDATTLIDKRVLITNGIRTESDVVSSKVQQYSQGAIQSISLGEPSVDTGLTRVPATVTVRVEDFRAYIAKVTVGEAPMGAGLFAQMSTVQDNQRSLEAIVYDKIVEPVLHGETVDFTVGKPIPFMQAQLPAQLLGGWNPAATVVFPVRLSLKPAFLQNIGKTLDSVASGYSREAISDANVRECRVQDRQADGILGMGLKFVKDGSILQEPHSSVGSVASTYLLSGARMRPISSNTSLDVQILDQAGNSIFEAIASDAEGSFSKLRVFVDRAPSPPPWVLAGQAGPCITVAEARDFKLIMEIDPVVLRNAARLTVKII